MLPVFQFELFGVQFFVNLIAVGGLVFLVVVSILIAQLPRVWRTDEEKLQRRPRSKESRPPENDSR